MSAPIGKGDWVERIDHDGEDPKGFMRCVEAISDDGLCDCGHIGPGLTLSGVAYAPEENGSCEAHWRPVYRPKSDLIQALKQPAPEAERELLTEDA